MVEKMPNGMDSCHDYPTRAKYRGDTPTSSASVCQFCHSCRKGTDCIHKNWSNNSTSLEPFELPASPSKSKAGKSRSRSKSIKIKPTIEPLTSTSLVKNKNIDTTEDKYVKNMNNNANFKYDKEESVNTTVLPSTSKNISPPASPNNGSDYRIFSSSSHPYWMRSPEERSPSRRQCLVCGDCERNCGGCKNRSLPHTLSLFPSGRTSGAHPTDVTTGNRISRRYDREMKPIIYNSDNFHNRYGSRPTDSNTRDFGNNSPRYYLGDFSGSPRYKYRNSATSPRNRNGIRSPKSNYNRGRTPSRKHDEYLTKKPYNVHMSNMSAHNPADMYLYHREISSDYNKKHGNGGSSRRHKSQGISITKVKNSSAQTSNSSFSWKYKWPFFIIGFLILLSRIIPLVPMYSSPSTLFSDSSYEAFPTPVSSSNSNDGYHKEKEEQNKAHESRLSKDKSVDLHPTEIGGIKSYVYTPSSTINKGDNTNSAKDSEFYVMPKQKITPCEAARNAARQNAASRDGKEGTEDDFDDLPSPCLEDESEAPIFSYFQAMAAAIMPKFIHN